MDIVIATKNRGKIRELEELLGPDIGGVGFKLITLDDCGFEGEIDENGESFEENSLIKAKAASEFTGLPAIADDSGLCVDALGGAPGIRSARFAGEGHNDAANNALLLEKLQGVRDRGAEFVCAMSAVFPDGSLLAGPPITVRGSVGGEILVSPRGEGGFGYDPLFWYDPLGKTFAELGPDEKNEVSHRADAVWRLRAALEERIAAAKEALWKKTME